jgi:hypothetical protein
VQACPEPLASATWTEVGDTPETYAGGAPLDLEPGGVGIVEAAGDTWLVWTPPNAGPRIRPLAGGDARDVIPYARAGLAQADLDGDGAMDLVLPGPVLEVVWGVGAADETTTQGWMPDGARMIRDAAVADLDGDGLPDLVLGFTTPARDDPELFRPGWLRNRGDRTFDALVAVAGDAASFGPAFDLSAQDLDQDGDPDLYVCNDFGAELAANVVIRNDDGALVVGDGAGLDVAASCMGVTWGDPTADGTPDVLVTAAARLYLFAGETDGFYDVSTARGLSALATGQMAWGAAMEDMDDDGRPDILVGTSDFYGTSMGGWPVWWFAQQADGTFVEEGEQHGVTTAGTPRSVVARDLNADGVLDLVVGNALRSPDVWLSDGCTAASWLEVEAPPGSRVRVTAGDAVWSAIASTEAGWASTAPARVHFGLGTVDAVDRVEIDAPWQASVTLDGPVPARRRIGWAP